MLKMIRHKNKRTYLSRESYLAFFCVFFCLIGFKMFESRKQAVFRCFCGKSITKMNLRQTKNQSQENNFRLAQISPCHQFQELNTLKNKHKQKVKGINSHASKGQVSCHRVSAFPKRAFVPVERIRTIRHGRPERLHVFAKVVYKRQTGLFHSFDDTRAIWYAP